VDHVINNIYNTFFLKCNIKYVLSWNCDKAPLCKFVRVWFHQKEDILLMTSVYWSHHRILQFELLNDLETDCLASVRKQYVRPSQRKVLLRFVVAMFLTFLSCSLV
jgi:hypothetical protein